MNIPDETLAEQQADFDTNFKLLVDNVDAMRASIKTVIADGNRERLINIGCFLVGRTFPLLESAPLSLAQKARLLNTTIGRLKQVATEMQSDDFTALVLGHVEFVGLDAEQAQPFYPGGEQEPLWEAVTASVEQYIKENPGSLMRHMAERYPTLQKYRTGIDENGEEVAVPVNGPTIN